jgi:hypothetical protein
LGELWAFAPYLIFFICTFGMICMGVLNIEKPPLAAFFALWGFGSYFVPLAIYEVYWRVKAAGGPAARIAMTTALGALTVLMAGGIAGMTVGQWLPLILAPQL